MIRYLFSILVVFNPLLGKIQETAHFGDIVNHVGVDTLLVLDIDDTLLLPVQTLGTDVWFIHRCNYHMQKHSKADAIEMAIDDWEAIRHITKVKIVEEGTDEIISSLQSKQVPIIGLTTQGCSLATCTIHQLASLKIDLSKSAPCDHDCYFMNNRGILYRHGILFTSGTEKGPALLKLFDLIGYQPKRVVFINDKETHLKDVEKSLLERNIEFIGLRYNIGDDRVANFDSSLADFQWSHSTFNHILSDDEAYALMKPALAAQE